METSKTNPAFRISITEVLDFIQRDVCSAVETSISAPFKYTFMIN